MPSIWPFGRSNKKKKLAIEQQKLDEKHGIGQAGKSKDKDYTVNSQNNLPAQIIRSLDLSTKENIFLRDDENEKDAPGQLFEITHGLPASPRQQASSIREPLVDVDNLAGARSTKQAPVGSVSSLQPETTFTTQPLYGIPTLHHRQSSTIGQMGRTKSSKSKASDRLRERELKETALPRSIPKRPASFSSGPLARDTKKFAGGLDRRLQRPTSEVSLPMVESLRTSFSGDVESHKGYRVSAFDALAPRPTIKYGQSPRSMLTRERSSRSYTQKDKGPLMIPEEPPMPANPRARVKELANDLDAREIRELMERDQRRKDRKKALNADKLKKKLELQQKLDRRAEKAAKLAAEPPVELEDTAPPGNAFEEPLLSDIPSPIASRRDTETSAAWTPNYSQDDLPSIEPFFGEPRLSSDQISMRDDAIIDTATAIRLSTISMSPPVSPVISREKTLSPSNLSYIANVVRDSPEPTSSIATSSFLHPEPRRASETSGKQGISWTSIFKRGGTKRKVSTDKGKEQARVSEFSNVSRESFMRKNQPPPIPIVQRSFKREGTLSIKQSKFKEDLPEMPNTPPRSRVQSPDLDRPLSPTSPFVDDAEKLDRINNDDDAAMPLENVHPALRDQVSSSRYPSYQAPSPEPLLLSHSLASVDSEGSWLSGRPRKRSSAQIGSIGSVRASVVSLAQTLEEHDLSEEPDFSRRDYSTQPMYGASGLSAQLRNIQPPSNDSDLPQSSITSFPYDESIKYDTVKGRRPNIVQRGPALRSREGLLDEFYPNEEDSPVSPLSPDSPVATEAFIHRATSINVGKKAGHARQLSAGSARLLDIPPRSSSDAKRSSVVSALSTTRSPLVSPRESRVISPDLSSTQSQDEEYNEPSSSRTNG